VAEKKKKEAPKPDPTGEFGQFLNAVGSLHKPIGAYLHDLVAGNARDLARDIGTGDTAFTNPKMYPGGDPEGKSDPKKGTKKKAKAKKSDSESPAQVQAAEEKAIADNPFNQLGQGLVADDQKIQAPLENAMAGGLTGPATSNAVAEALSASGLGGNAQAKQWLNANIAQANANDAPLAQAMAQYGAAYNTGQQGVDQALANMGQANALANTVAPEQQWLNALATHIQSNLNYYGTIPNWAVGSGSQALPPALQYYLQTTGTGQATGTTPLQNIQVPGAPKTTNSNPLASVAIPSTTGATPGVLAPGTGAAPS
jgi:hypothetical protein